MLEEVAVAAEATDEDYYLWTRAGFRFDAFYLVAEELDDFGNYFGEDLAKMISGIEVSSTSVYGRCGERHTQSKSRCLTLLF